MTNQEILDYFNTNVYTFNGSLAELDELQQSNNNSYTYLIVGGIIYFKSDSPLDGIDTRVELFVGE